MTANAEGRKASFFDDFKALSLKQILAIVLAILIALALEVIGFGVSSCIGFLVVAVVLYMLPHMLGVMSVKVKAVIGVVFVVLAILIGTFAYTGVVGEYTKLIDQENDKIKDINVTYNETEGTYDLDFMVNPVASGIDGAWNVDVKYGEITMVAYGLAGTSGLKDYKIASDQMTPMENGWYQGKMTIPGLTEGKFEYIGIYVQSIGEDNKETAKVGLVFAYDSGITYGDILKINAYGSGYAVGMAAFMFFIILLFSALMRHSAQKTRAKMEEDGRLYPQGYGRCKACGAMVLPGEVVCRKCGEYIDVPDEMRAKKKDYVTCSECGAEVPADAEVCPKCGAAFDEDEEVEISHADGTVDTSSDTIPCPHCSKDIPSNAEWCPKCGKKIKE